MRKRLVYNALQNKHRRCGRIISKFLQRQGGTGVIKTFETKETCLEFSRKERIARKDRLKQTFLIARQFINNP